MPDRFQIHAEALWALRRAHLIDSDYLKESVKRIIYQSSETSNWHYSAQYRSLAAADKIADAIKAGTVHSVSSYHRFCNATQNQMRHEHMVPTAVVYRLVVDHTQPSVQAYEALLRACGYRATILISEDKRLLRSSLPDLAAFQSSPHLGFYDHRCRYRQTKQGAPIELEERPEAGWAVRGY